MQVTLGFVILFLLGYLLILVLIKEHKDVFGLFAILISMFIAALIFYSAVYQEKLDTKRRATERHLLFASITDPLTLLWNQGFFFESAILMLKRANCQQENNIYITPNQVVVIAL